MRDRLRANANLIDSLGSATRHGGAALSDAPELLRRVLEEEAWREFVTQRGDRVEYQAFSKFVATPPLKGLGVDMALIDRLVGTEDLDLLRLLKAAKAGRPGPKTAELLPVESTGNSYGRDRSDATADRLARDAPEQYNAVQSGDLSINAAAVLAGIRPRRISVRLDRPDSIARSLRKHLTSDQVAQLIALLLPGGDAQ